MPLRPFTPGENPLVADVTGLASPEDFEEVGVTGAAFRTENVVGSAYAKFVDMPSDPTEDEYQAYSDGTYDYRTRIPERHKEYSAEYARYALTDRHADWVTQRLDNLNKDRQAVADGGFTGFLAGTFAAMTSPEQYPLYFIPGTLLLKPATRMGSRAAATYVGTEAAIGATSAAVQEALLHSTQPSRTVEESKMAIAASALFSGMLTGGIIGVRHGVDYRKSIADRIDTDTEDMIDAARTDDMVAPPPSARHAGAAEVDSVSAQAYNDTLSRLEQEVESAKLRGEEPDIGTVQDLEALRELTPDEFTSVKHPRLYEALGIANPNVRLATQSDGDGRMLAASIVDDSLLRVANLYGHKMEASLETRMLTMEKELGIKLQNQFNKFYEKYVTDIKKLQDEGAKDTELLHPDLFAAEVGKAHRNNYEHENPAIASFAKAVYKDITGVIEKRLDDQDMLPRRVLDGQITKLTPEVLEQHGIEAGEKYFKKDGNPRSTILKTMPQDDIDKLVRTGVLDTELAPPKGDETHLYRAYNHAEIEADGGAGFRKTAADYFEQEIRASYQEAINDALGGVRKIEAKITALDTKLDTMRKKNKKRWGEQQETPEEAALRRLNEQQMWAEHRLAVKEALDAGEPPPKWSYKRTTTQIRNDLEVELQAAKKEVADMEARLKDDGIKADKSELYYETSGADKIRKMARDAAEAYYKKVVNSSYEPNMGIELQPFDVGPLKMRTIDIPSSVIEKYIDNDIRTVLANYTRSVLPQLHFKEQFDPAPIAGNRTGTADQAGGLKGFMNEVKKIADRYEARSIEASDAGDVKLAKKLRKEQGAVVRDMEAVKDILYNRYALPGNPDSLWYKSMQKLREFNVMAAMGSVVAASFGDLGQFISRQGMRGMAGAINNFTVNYKNSKYAAEFYEAMGVGADIDSAGRLEKMYMMDDQYRPDSNSVFEKTWTNGRKLFTKATGMPVWNNAWKNQSAIWYMHNMVKHAIDASAGRLDKSTLAQYARAGIDKADLIQISKEITEEQKAGNIWLPDLPNWVDKDLAERMKHAVLRNAEISVVTPGAGDLPLTVRKPMGKVIGQFRGYSFAANQKVVLAGIDDFGAKQMSGLMMGIVMGYMSYVAKQTIKGEDFELDYDTFIREGLDRSGRLAFWGELNGMVSKATTGKADLYRALGAEQKVMSRYASRNMLGAIFGISAGRLQDLTQITSAITSGEFSESDIRAVRRSIIFNNLWFTHYGFTQAEKAMQ